ncbi:MAG TPA: HU family DNA-binding protein [Ignavibacteria bacterium]|nr:HU family DNA-binding protein [Ignavibacteria bacterium]
MNKSDIISAVSIEFGLSKEQAERTVNSLFIIIGQSLKKYKILEIQKFGKFRLTSDKDNEAGSYEIKFAPSKKLSVRVNGKFDNLKKVKIKFGSVPDIKDFLITAADKSEKPAGQNLQETDTAEQSAEEKIIPGGQRKLISEDLVKLHKEITKEVKDEKGSVNNLWG